MEDRIDDYALTLSSYPNILARSTPVVKSENFIDKEPHNEIRLRSLLRCTETTGIGHKNKNTNELRSKTYCIYRRRATAAKQPRAPN